MTGSGEAVGHMTRPAGRSGVSKMRLLLLLGGGAGLLAGMWTGLARAGVALDSGPLAQHGLLMTLGFLGTLIALERAVAYRATWSYLAPAASGVAILWLLLGGPTAGAGALFLFGGALVSVMYARMLLTQHEPYLILMGVGGLGWVVAAALWTAGANPVRVTPMLAAFLVLTIVGERLELSRLRRPTHAATIRMLLAAVVFIVGTALSWFAYRLGLVVAGAGLLTMTAWFVHNDVARVTIRHHGLPRFAAACMLAGYVWLGVGGALWVVQGLQAGGPLIHDAAVHAVFLGFVISMVIGHAPIIMPAVLRIALPYQPIMWLPLVLLHLTVAIRVIADLAGSAWGRGVTAAGNTIALFLFVAVSVAIAVHARFNTALTTDDQIPHDR